MKSDQMARYIVYPVQQTLGLYSPGALCLEVGTANMESDLAEYLGQTTFLSTLPTILGPSSPPLKGGIGPWQMEHNDHEDIHKNYLAFHPTIANKLYSAFGGRDQCFSGRMLYDLNYGAAMCRIHYLRCSDPLPDYKDVAGLAAYHKKYYNSSLGASDPNLFVAKYNATCAVLLNKFVESLNVQGA